MSSTDFLARSDCGSGRNQGAPKVDSSTNRVRPALFSLRRSYAKSRSNGRFPCAPFTIDLSGSTRVWHSAHENTPTSTFPLVRITYRKNGNLPSAVSEGWVYLYHSGSRTGAFSQVLGASKTISPALTQSASVFRGGVFFSSQTTSGSCFLSHSK